MKLAAHSILQRLVRGSRTRWLAAGLACMLAAPVFAQSFPNKPIRLVVPFAAGGPADVLGRVVSESMGRTLGQSILVDNKAGAAGTIGVDSVAKSAPDGYTMALVPVGNIAVNPSLMPNLPYKQSDLAPIAMLATAENVLVVNASVPVKNLADLLKLANQKAGQLTYASPGAGSQAHLAGELLQLEANVKMIHVPYRGVSPAMTDLVGGQVTMMIAQVQSALPYIKSGKLHAIGVASPKRSPLLPDVPTIAEQGFPKFEAISWYALMAPANTPRDVLNKLNQHTNTALAETTVKEKLAGLGMKATGGTPEQLASAIQSESARWAEVIRQRNITID
ncbi:MAG TPA: tripartite tricarboxylate transporter substrate binding protein [Burkholderiaceae bacterium]|jgi:tripartite-type tricarboxylate transporter receptor subunit TctC|nr:tripartite tricarboxylate transporter substrate binding protein [Burkholderiaceae bacterium]